MSICFPFFSISWISGKGMQSVTGMTAFKIFPGPSLKCYKNPPKLKARLKKDYPGRKELMTLFNVVEMNQTLKYYLFHPQFKS